MIRNYIEQTLDTGLHIRKSRFLACFSSSSYKGNVCHLPHEPCFRASKKYQPQCQPWINKPLGPWIVLLQSYHFLVANHHFLEVTHASQSTRVY